MSDLADALAFYRREMSAANRAFFQGKIDALCRDTGLTDKQRLDKLAPLFKISKWGTSGHGSSIKSPQELLIHPGEPGYVDLGINNDGTTPPVSEEAQREYLDHLKSLLDEATGSWWDEPVEPPTEFTELLTMTDAISDMDFRQSGTSGLHGTCNYVSRYDMSDRQPGQREWYDDGWAVVTGWRCAFGSADGATLLLYAYKQNGTEEEQQIKWRVHTWDDNEYRDGVWFSSIVDYLRYSCQWLSRLPAGWQGQPPARDYKEENYESEGEEEDEEENEDENQE